MKVRGYRIELGEVEAALRQQPQVHEAVVIVSPAASGGKIHLIAYVLTEQETTLTTSALRGGAERIAAGIMVPGAFVKLEELPLTASGKVDRRRCRRRSGARSGWGECAARRPAEEMVAGIWGEVLGREKSACTTTSSSWAGTRCWRRN